MRIGINARYSQGGHTGIGKYVLNLSVNCRKIDSENEYFLFLDNNNPVPRTVKDAGFNCRVSTVSTGNQAQKLFWQHVYLPDLIRAEKIDVFHEPSFVMPVFKTAPTVITVHDLAYLRFPEGYTRRNLIYLKGLLGYSLKRADRVIVVSESTRRDIIGKFKVPENKVRVVYEGVDSFYSPGSNGDEAKKIKEKYALSEKFILAVSTISPRKNFVRLIEAYNMIKKSGKFEEKLVIAGGKGWLYEEVFEKVALFGLEKDVIFCGSVTDEDLLHLYRSAAVFVYPSLYEGFGLPILEAMACGCPVVASKVSSIPEVCGDAAVLIDPEKIDAIKEAIEDVLESSQLRQNLITNGKKQAAKFSWSEAAEKTLAIYYEAADSKKKS